jgi:ectoine hydroxylase-related dioxygenase (phytanoyl-CoA dioxygenase family)
MLISIINNIIQIFRKITSKDKYVNLTYFKKNNQNSLINFLKKDKILPNFFKFKNDEIEELENEIKKILANFNQTNKSVYVNNINSNQINLIKKYHNLNDPIFKIALKEEILDLVVNYFGERAILWDLRILKSQNIKNLQIKHDQLWHRDKYDSKSLRLWVSLSDCDEDCGPFQYLNYDDSRNVLKSYITRINDEYLQKKNIFNNIKHLYTKKGDISLIDVSKLLHCGSRIKPNRTRLVFNAIYTTAKPYKKPTLNPSIRQELLNCSPTNLQKSFLSF